MWAPGRYQYPFVFTAMEPCTYHGHELNIDWYLLAQAEMPHARPAKARAEYLVSPPPQKTNATAASGLDGVFSKTAPVDDSSPSEAWRVAAVAVCLLVLAGLAAAYYYVPTTREIAPDIALPLTANEIAAERADNVWWCMLLATPFLAIALWLLYQPVVVLLWRARVGVRLVAGASEVRPGTELACAVRVPHRRSHRIRSVSLRLRAQEEATSGYDTNESTTTWDVHDEELLCGSPLRTGRHHYYVAKAKIPADAPLTFESTKNRLHWFIEACVEGPLMPRWTARRAVRVWVTDS